MKLKINSKISYVLFLLFILLSYTLTTLGLSDKFLLLSSTIQFLLIILIISAIAREISIGKIEFIIIYSAIACRAIYAIYTYGQGNLSEPALVSDANGFWTVASRYYENMSAAWYTYFPKILNMEFHIFGRNILSCMYFNIFCVTLMILLVVSVLNRYQVSGKLRLISVFIVSFLPYSLIVTNNLWRESLYFFFLTASFYKYIDYINTDKWSDLLLSFALLAPVLLLHIGYFPLILAYILDIFTHDRSKFGRISIKKLVLLVFAGLFVIIVMSFKSMSYISLDGEDFLEGIISKLNAAAEVAAESAYLTDFQITSIGSLILYVLLKFVYYLLSPLPWDWRNISDAVAFLMDSCVHCYLLGASIKCVLSNRKASYEHTEIRVAKAGIIAVVLCAAVFGVGTIAAGTALRHRCPTIGIEIITFALAKNIYQVKTDASPRICGGVGKPVEK